MKNVIKKILSKKTTVFALVGVLWIGQGVAFGKPAATASAEEAPKEIVYCDDTVYGNDSYAGEGVHINANYTIDADELVIDTRVAHPSAPSFGNANPNLTNTCGPVAGTNIVVFYDQWHTNLVPNYEPGMMVSSGYYRYFPDVGNTATTNVISSLYSTMNVATVGGTTSANFKSGMSSFVSGRGYTFSYYSMHQNATTVNLSTLATAINQGKIGMVMCSQYNFVDMVELIEENNYVAVSKMQSTTAHMMMVYGYDIMSFYKAGNLVCTKTFLHVSSGFGSCDKGYMELNDFSTINEALIVSIT